MGLLGNKAFALQQALLCLAQKTEALSAHVLDVLADPKLLKKPVPRNAWAVVNATASLAVRDAVLEAAPKLHAPVIEAAIWGRGAAATLRVESTGGNPNVGDMVAALYERARRDSVLSLNGLTSTPAIGTSSAYVGLTHATGVAARRAATVTGVLLIALAFLP
jgi:hypothetical protein